MTLDSDDRRFRKGVESLLRIAASSTAARAAKGALIFARLDLLPTQANEVPSQVPAAPAC